MIERLCESMAFFAPIGSKNAKLVRGVCAGREREKRIRHEGMLTKRHRSCRELFS